MKKTKSDEKVEIFFSIFTDFISNEKISPIDKACAVFSIYKNLTDTVFSFLEYSISKGDVLSPPEENLISEINTGLKKIGKSIINCT